MSCLGVFFSIDDKTVIKLSNIKRSNIVDYLQEEIEEVYFEKYVEQVAEVDKAWDAIQRAFSDSELSFTSNSGVYPSNIIVFGGKILYGDKDDEDDYIISLKNPLEVKDIYKFLSNLTKDQFRDFYFNIDKDKYGFDVEEDDFEYTWTWLSNTLAFWENASNKGLYVIFTVDQ